MEGRPRVAAYVLLADPSFLVESIRAYYPYVDRIILSYDETSTSWTGTALPVAQCRELVRALDRDRKCVEMPGRFARLEHEPLENDTFQRQAALDAASDGADWVLQLDTDEVMLRPESFFAALWRADRAGASGLEYPARWLYTRGRSGRYLELSSRFWHYAASYPGPLAVRAGTALRLARQSDVPLYRVDFQRRNTDPWHPTDAKVDEVIRPDEAVLHFSWVRDPAVIRRKFGWSGHTEEMKPPRIYRDWERRTRNPSLAAALTPLRLRPSAWYRLSRVPEPPGGVPIRVVDAVHSMASMSTGPQHTVCVVTFERPDFLRRCLDALRRHVTADTEIVVVDASAHAADDLAEASSSVTTYVHAPALAGWMTRSRNEALLHSHGRIVSFIDDDVVVSATWQSAVLTAFDDETVDAVAGRTRNNLPGEEHYDHPVGRLRPDGSLTEGFGSMPEGAVEVDHGIGANMSFRRAVLARLGGFRDDYPGTAIREDTDMYLRIKHLGGRAVFVPTALVDHLPAPHVKGARFDTRYKLYARRNHMVMLARYAGIGSPMLRGWVRRQFAGVWDAEGVSGKVERAGVVTVGVAWGAAAMALNARWRPLRPERDDAKGAALRDALSS